MSEYEYIVEMRHITKRFPKIVANDDISFGIKKGEIFALLGENGAGKSTLMSMLFGLYEPDGGEIYIRGKHEKITSPNHAAKLDIGMVHQHFKLVENYTITENILLGMEPQKKYFGLFPYVDIKTGDEKIRELSKRYGLEVEPTSKIEDVNVSTQQRVEILKMLYREAEILIFDEPTAMLTPQEIEFLLSIIRSLRDGGKTIILITHKLEEIKQVADRCAILCHGKLTGIVDAKITTAKEMANLMVGREMSFDIEKPPAEFGGETSRVEGLTVKNAKGFAVVKNVSFSVRSGEIFAIAGVSGNGQIEVADAIAGLTGVSAGKIMLDGKDITHYDIRRRRAAGISYIPEDRQSYGLVLDFSLADNTALKNYYIPPFCENGMLDRSHFEEYGGRLIEKYDIRSSNGTATQVRSMSGGNQQKAIIAREIELGSPLMIFVQPTRGIDIGATTAIHEKILEERSRGRAILLISLELEEIMSLADTIGVIYNGEMQKIADAAELTANEVGEFMMGVKSV